MACYFCGCESCIVERAYDKGYIFYQCDICGRYVLTDNDIMHCKPQSIDKDIVANYLYHNIRLNAKGREPAYACLICFDEMPQRILQQHPHFHAVTYETMQAYYPKTISDRALKTLMAIAKLSQFPGEQLEMSADEAISLLFIRRFSKNGTILEDADLNMQYEHLIKYLDSNEYAMVANGGNDTIYMRLLAKGQEYLEQRVEKVEDRNTLDIEFSSEYLSAQIKTIENIQDNNPTAAIGMAKELIESCCKTIMNEHSIPFDTGWQFDRLVSETLDLLGLKAKKVDINEPQLETVKKLLGNLRSIAESVNTLRNSHGGGHGKPADFKALSPKYAHLAVGASTTFIRFLWETHKEQMQ